MSGGVFFSLDLLILFYSGGAKLQSGARGMLQVNGSLFGDHCCLVLDEKKFDLRGMIAEIGVELAGIAKRRGQYLALDMPRILTQI